MDTGSPSVVLFLFVQLAIMRTRMEARLVSYVIKSWRRQSFEINLLQLFYYVGLA